MGVMPMDLCFLSIHSCRSSECFSFANAHTGTLAFFHETFLKVVIAVLKYY